MVWLIVPACTVLLTKLCAGEGAVFAKAYGPEA